MSLVFALLRESSPLIPLHKNPVHKKCYPALEKTFYIMFKNIKKKIKKKKKKKKKLYIKMKVWLGNN